MKFLQIALLCCFGFLLESQSIDYTAIALFPQQNDFRNTLNLSGIWKFKKDSGQIGEKQNWQNGLTNAVDIAVPGSWNEQFTDSRDYLGMVWYERETYVPSTWKGQKILIRIGSATYAAKLWVNGQLIGNHEGGNLPFVFDMNAAIKWGASNRITIQVENILKPSRVPTGDVTGGLFSNFPKANYDFFPYSGLHRDIWLYSIPSTASIKDLTVRTGFQNTTGTIEIKVDAEGKATQGKILITGNSVRFEKQFQLVSNTSTVNLSIPDVQLWSPENPFLYKMNITIGDSKNIYDHYFLETGVRTIATTDKQILLNGKPIFLKGFGKHEDFPILGRGVANPVIVKDYSLMKWIGANSFRTSHYPYDEEYMRMADREGFLVIDEIPAVGLFFHGDSADLEARQLQCKKYLHELISRDKNHPSVIMWSVANEPFPKEISLSSSAADRAASPKSIECFKELIALTKELDNTRLVTLAGVMGGPMEWLGLCDVICLNRYFGWYTNTGDMQGALKFLNMELDAIHKRYHKPIVMTEFGADTYAGMHSDQSEMFTEEFQTEIIKNYLDFADSKDYMAGMHVWAFADFKTSQGIIRFGGMNYKGVFTRDRKPKAAAFYLKNRWNK